MDRIVPTYSLTEDLTQRSMRRVMFQAVQQFADAATTVLPDKIRERHSLPLAPEVIRHVSFSPTRSSKLRVPGFALVFEEFLCVQLILAARKARAEHVVKGFKQKCSPAN